MSPAPAAWALAALFAVSPALGLVQAIEIRSETPIEEDDLEEVMSLLAVEIGQPLDEDAVRRTLRNLQALGIGQQLELYARDEPEGTVAVVVIRPGVRVSEVRLEGELGLARSALVSALPQKSGQPLSEESVVRGVFNLLTTYEELGYFAATARVAVQPLGSRHVAVVYTVASGERADVGAVGFAGPIAPLAPAALVRHIRSRPGTAFSQETAKSDAERLTRWLYDQGYRTARVEPPALDFDAASTTVGLTFTVVVGPQVRLTVDGASERTLRRKDLLPILGEAGYDEALVLETVNRIRADYQRQGHYRVKVQADESREDGALLVHLEIVPGPRYTLEAIDFTGNEAFSDGELADLMATAPRSLVQPGSGRLVDRVLNEDLANIRRFYALQGFAEAKVERPEVRESGEELALSIAVREGPQRRLASLALVGCEALDLKELAGRLPLEEGGPFHSILLDNALSQVRAAFAELGYTEAQVEARQEWNADQTVVDLTITAEPGIRQLVDRVIVRGNVRTESEVIRRTAGLTPGEPVSESQLLETERSLYRLGIFSGVDVDLSRPGLGTSDRDVLIRVEEGRPRRVLYGLGWDSEDGPRGLAGFSHNNVAGRAVSLQTDLRLSDREKRFRFVLSQPTLVGRPITFTSTAFYEEEARRDKPFEVTRYGARVEAVRTFGARRVSLGLDHRTVELLVDPGVISNEIERQSQPYQLTSVIPTVFWDRRNDPIHPTRGQSSLLQVQYAFPAFATDAELLKVFLHHTQYFSLGSRRGVVAASLRLGGIEPWSELAVSAGDPLAGLPSHNVPIAERFFAGGDATHRAYGRDELGIRGETVIQASNGGFLPVGGDGLLIANLEWRIPLFGAFEGTVFYDAGNVWADWRDIHPSDFKQGVGLGLRYISPIGPIRAGVGYKLDREPGESEYEFFLNVGNPF